MDQFVFDKSLSPQEDKGPFREKRVVYVNDSNNGSYNGQINIDTTVLSNGGAWCDYSQATLEIPFVVALKSSADITTTANAYMLGLKNGSHQIIDSIQVQYQNSTVKQQQAFENFHVGYKIMSEWSSDDLIKYGPQIRFAPDSAGSFQTGASGALGLYGPTNNRPFPPVSQRSYASTAPIEDANSGFGDRLKMNAWSASNPVGVMSTVAQANQIGKSYFTDDSGSGAARIYTWKMLLTIRLKDVSDFFAKLPLVRGAQIRLTVNYNAARVVLTGTQALNLSQTSTSNVSGRSVPIMISSCATGAPLASTLSLADQTLSISCNVHSTSDPAGSASDLLPSCRLYVPTYILGDEDQIKYLSLGRKEMLFTDIVQFNVRDVAAGASFNQIITNGIVNPQSVVVIPVLNAASGNVVSGASLSPFQSMFDTCPGTTAPCGALTQFNVYVSGEQVFQSNEQYDFDAFQNEVATLGISGGQQTGLVSGLLSRYSWDNAYRYYVADIARRHPQDDKLPLSVSIVGTNNTSKILDLYVFVSFQRKLVIDLASGAIVQG